eukprot:TRINITY_DN90672_c0_g1_i1.p1 TRINITY_DN90672_c0_g1~~TRINITY_DN90672_c0_g1_i1.p1  ORF type:complete len:377 (-),score=37.75 TRINITY_DN90672_c0_g1_i1:209-1339(-)
MTEIEVDVVTAAGESMQVSCSTTDSVERVKEQIAEHWHVPVICQTLLHLGTELLDDDIIGDCYEEDAQLCLLTNPQPIYDMLKNPDPFVRLEAVDNIASMTLTDYEHAIASLANRLEKERHPGVRDAAIRALAMVAQKGDEKALTALATACVAESNRFRGNEAGSLACMEAVSQLVDWGDSAADSAVRVVQKLANDIRRKSVQEALIAAVLKKTQDQGELGRARAVSVIRQVPGPGETAMRLLVKLARRGDAETCTVIANRLATEQGVGNDERALALTALGLTKSQSWEGALELLPYTFSKDAGVRRAAVEAVGRLVSKVTKAQRSRQEVVDRVAACLYDSDHFVREAALAALGRLSQAGDHKAATILASTDEDCL